MDRMKILLIKPHPPLALSKLLMDCFLHLEPLELEIVAGGVPAEDEVAIMDLSFEKEPFEAFRKKLLAMKPDIVGYTGFSSQAALVRELAAFAKKQAPSVFNVVGGIHATVIPSDYASEGIDAIVRGEGGTAFREVVSRFRQGLPVAFGDVVLSPGDPDFAAKASTRPPKFPKVEDIPLPRRDLVDRSKYFNTWTGGGQKRLDTIFPRTATVRTSHGCPFNCSFCVVHYVMGGQYLQRPAEDVVDEISKLKENHIYFVDDENFVNNERMTKIATLLLERGIKKRYVGWARSDTVVRHPELFELWEKTGLDTVYIGLETMAGERLEKINKRTTVETNRKAVEILHRIGITMHASFMLDPDFGEEDFAVLKEEVKKICPMEITVTVFSPSPGTELWEKHKNDFIKDPYLYYDCLHTLLPTRLPLKRFYGHFAEIYGIAFRANPLRHNRTRYPLREFFTIVSRGFKYVVALRNLYREYEPKP